MPSVLKIGQLEIGLPAVQAALSGYSDRAMRMVARHYGAELTMNEVILDKLVLQKGKLRDRMLALGKDDHPVVGQLMGSDPDQFAGAADELVRAGYDIIDINFGCPVRKVLGRCRGGYLLSEPENALRIVGAVVESVGGRRPVTIKMRRSFEDTRESEADFFRILDGAWERGVRAVTVHGRTVKQRYIGPSKWPFLAKVKKHVGDRTVLGSGDLFSAMDVKRMLEETGVDGAAIARGAIGNPFLFRETRALLEGNPLPPPPSVAEQREAIELHSKLATEVYGPERTGVMMRKFWIRYSDLHPRRADVRGAALRASTTDELLAMLDRWYDPDKDWGKVTRPESPADLVAAGATQNG